MKTIVIGVLLATVAALTLLAAVQYRELRRMEGRLSRMELLEGWER